MKIIQKLLYIYLFFNLSTSSYAQSFNVDIQYSYQNLNSVALGVNYYNSKYLKEKKQLIEFGTILSLELLKIKNKFIYSPKIALDFGHYINKNRLAYTFGVGLIRRNNESITDWSFVPEIGITFIGLIKLSYGYNIHFSNDKINEISNNKISITINIGYRFLDNHFRIGSEK